MKLYCIGEHQDVTTTVGELVAELQKLDQNLPVFTEGCDCMGNVVAVSLRRDGSVLIERDDSAYDYPILSGIGMTKKLAERYEGRVFDLPNWSVKE